MEFATIVPSRMISGRPLQVPLVVKITSSTSGSVHDAFDINGAWIYLSLVTADRSRSLAPPREDLLRGTRVDSIHPTSTTANGLVATLGHAIFTNVAISEPGRYCFRVNMVRMPRQSAVNNGSSAQVLPDLYSRVVDVVNA